jgi:GNAT superfamily N-acetyltransferase
MTPRPRVAAGRVEIMIEKLTAAEAGEIIDVFCDAFHDYPVMTATAGPAADYDQRLRTLIGLFVMTRVRRGDPLFGIRNGDGRLVAAMTMTAPGGPPLPADTEAHRAAVWTALGETARLRYESMALAWAAFDRPETHHHVNMIGVRRADAGRGLGRRLLDEAFALAIADPASSGVSLTTEDAVNVEIYRHLGYEVVGRVPVTGNLQTWGLFRPRRPAGARVDGMP